VSELLELGKKDLACIYVGENQHKYISILKLNTDMSEKQKNKLLNLIVDGYFNTDIDIDDFSCEFYAVSYLILNRGCIPLELKYLAIEQLYKEIASIFK
jgi:hypothetical protein